MKMFNKAVTVVGIGILVGLGFIDSGSALESCTYTEKTLTMNSKLKSGTLTFINNALIIDEPYLGFKCLAGFKLVKGQIVPIHVGAKRDDGRSVSPHLVRSVNERSKIELTPIRLVAVEAHGLSTVDSGRAPIELLVVRDRGGNLYQLPIVYLGYNKGDEFLKLKSSDGVETVLSAESKLFTH